MKRDMDLVREILLEVEKWQRSRERRSVELAGRDPQEIEGHVLILGDAGLLNVFESGSHQAIYVTRLTWQGHEFLEAARNPKTWEEAKSTFREKSIGMSFDLLKEVLVALGRAGLGVVLT